MTSISRIDGEMATMNNQGHSPLYGDIKGFILYPSTRKRVGGGDSQFTPLQETFEKKFVKGAGKPSNANKSPIRNAMPASIATDPRSYNPLRLDLAAHLLHDDPHSKFLTVADTLTDRHAPASSPLHLHGINYDSTIHQPEPSLATIFNDPTTPQQLQRITADAATFTGQSGAMSFFPHPDGREQLLHMRVPTHSPGRQLSPQAVAEAVNKVTQAFSGDRWGRKLLSSHFVYPDETGHSDVLAWVGAAHPNPAGARQVFARLAGMLGTEFNAGPQYWMGTGDVVGGMSPHDDGTTTPPIPAAVKVGVPVNPVQMARGVPTTPDELRAMIHGWLENPRVQAYPRQLIPDMLEETNHPASGLWNWHQQHAIPAAQSVERTKPVSVPPPRAEPRYLTDTLSGIIQPPAEPYRHGWWAANPDTLDDPDPNTSAYPFVASSLLRGLSIPSPHKNKNTLLDRIYRTFPQHADAIARMVAARELHATGLITPDELHQHTTDAINGREALGNIQDTNDPAEVAHRHTHANPDVDSRLIRPALAVNDVFTAHHGQAPYSAFPHKVATTGHGLESRPYNDPTYNATRNDVATAIHRMVESARTRLARNDNPVRLAWEVSDGPHWSPQWRTEHDRFVPDLVQGILENPQDTFRHAILSDRLRDLGHPYGPLLAWYALEGLPAYLAGAKNPINAYHYSGKIANKIGMLKNESKNPALMGLLHGAMLRKELADNPGNPRIPKLETLAKTELGHLGVMPYGDPHTTWGKMPMTATSVWTTMHNLTNGVAGDTQRAVDSHGSGVEGFDGAYRRRFKTVSVADDPRREAEQFARSPAGSGAVIRGVFYSPGKMMPDLIEGPQAPQEPRPQEPRPQEPRPPEPPKIQAPAPPVSPAQTGGRGGGKLTIDRLRGMVGKRRTSSVMSGNGSPA